MEKPLFISVVITVVFFIVKMIEMRMSADEPKPLKYAVRDTFIVFFASFVPLLVFFQTNGNLSSLFGAGDEIVQTQIFTGEPEF